jgi:hypothetical protein
VRPALFAKQVVMMLLALNRIEFGESHPELREYVLARDAVGLPTRCRLFLSLFDAPVARHGALYAHLDLNSPEHPRAFVTDLLDPPFAYTVTIDEVELEPRPGEITWFTTLGPDSVRDIELVLPGERQRDPV